MKKVFLLLMIVLSLALLVACEDDMIIDKVQIPTDQYNENVQNVTPSDEGTRITAQEAEAFALTHAGFAREDVTRLHTEYDRDWINHYDVEFHKDGFEYEYEIHAENGEVLKYERERND